MIRSFFLTCFVPAALFMPFFAGGQTVQTQIESYTLCPGDNVVTTVHVTGLNSVASISLSLLYDTSATKFLGYSDVHPALSSGVFLVNDTDNFIKIAWFSIGGVNVGTDTLIRFSFKYLGGYGYLNWDTANTGACQFGNPQGMTIPTNFISGYLAADGVFISHPEDDTIVVGDTAAFSVQAFGNTLSYKWQENSGSGWVDVFNGILYSGANGPHLQVKQPPLQYSGNQYRCRTTGTCPTPNNQFYSEEAALVVNTTCQPAYAFAGEDTTIFENQSIGLIGQAQNQQSVQWFGGDGFFIPGSNSLSVTYQPGSQDIANGAVTLVFVAYATPPCANDTDSISITILPVPVNNPPSFMSGGNPADTLFLNTFFGTDSVFCVEVSDPEGDPVQLYLGSTTPQHAVLQFLSGSDTCFLYSPDPLWLGTDSFELQACDQSGGCDTALLIVNTTLPANNLPPMVIGNGLPVSMVQKAVQMNLGGEICLELFDPEAEACDINAALTGPFHGQLSGLGNGDSCISYIPDTMFMGTDSLWVSICDIQGACDSVLLLVSVIDMNIPYSPDAADDHFSGPEDQVLVCQVLQNDFDINANLDTSSLVVHNIPSHGTFYTDTSQGVIAYYPAQHYWGNDTFTYIICDGSGLCDTARVSLSINSVFDPPQQDTFQIAEDSISSLSILDNDSYPFQELDTSSLVIVVHPKNGTANPDILTGTLSYTPAHDWNGTDSLSYRICDTMGNCGIAKVIIEVLPVNDAPGIQQVNGTVVNTQAPSLTLSTCQGKEMLFGIRYADPEGDTAFVSSISTQGSAATVYMVDDTTVRYMPAPGYFGLDHIEITLSDGIDSLVHTLRIWVSYPPFINAGPNASVCAGESFENTSVSKFFVRSVKWETYGSGFFLDDTVTEAVYVPSNQDIQSGQVKLEVTAYGFDSCGTHTDHLFLTFKALPEIELGGDTILCKNYSITLDAGPGYISYHWSNGSGGRYLSLDTSLLPAPGGVVGVSVTDTTGCSNDDQIVVSFVDCPGFDEWEPGGKMILYPNPADQYLMVRTDMAGADKMDMVVVDMTGRVVSRTSGMNIRKGEPYLLDTSNYEPGLYLIVIGTGDERFSGRFMVWHSF